MSSMCDRTSGETLLPLFRQIISNLLSLYFNIANCLIPILNVYLIDATNKLEEALNILHYIQDTGVVKSGKAKTAIYELLTKV
ncbi:MAG TPA: hypothetical protein VK211_17640 [Kamptonema sp.]|nr:hypothetical protein [Kamptonema sp.]